MKQSGVNRSRKRKSASILALFGGAFFKISRTVRLWSNGITFVSGVHHNAPQHPPTIHTVPAPTTQNHKKPIAAIAQ